MEKIRLGILGIGNQGTKYSKAILAGECPDFTSNGSATANPTYPGFCTPDTPL